MRRRSLVAALLVAAAVLLAFSWFGWGREGLTPVRPASTGADEINELYGLLGAVAVLIFLSVILPLALILGRYRERGLPREAEGPQIRGNTPLELTWTAIPVVIVLVLSGIALWKAIEIADPATAAGAPADLRIEVEGRQFYWRYVYENGAVAIDRLRLPVDRVAELEITAPDADVVHSFWAPALGAKMDAVPGQVNELKLKPTRTGQFEGKCAELCGIQHSIMLLTVEVLPQAEFEQWLRATAAEQQSDPAALGAVLFGERAGEGVCQKCHFVAPEYAPSLAGNPLLANEDAMREIVTNGRGRMPAVGRGWTERELDALLRYLPAFAGQGAGSGG